MESSSFEEHLRVSSRQHQFECVLFGCLLQMLSEWLFPIFGIPQITNLNLDYYFHQQFDPQCYRRNQLLNLKLTLSACFAILPGHLTADLFLFLDFQGCFFSLYHSIDHQQYLPRL